MASAILVVACQSSTTTRPAAPRAVTAVAEQPPEPPPQTSPTPDAAPPEPGDTPLTAEFVADGTLLVTGKRTLVARGPDGTMRQVELEPNATVGASVGFAGVVIQGPNGDVRLLATPSLTELYAGKGDVPMVSRNVVRLGRSVHLQHGGKLATLTLPSSLKEPVQIEEIVAIGSNRLNVTYGLEGEDRKHALLFDADTARVIGDGVPVEGMSGLAPKGAIAGSIGFRIEGSQIARLDMTTGKVERQATIRCKPDQELGNPTPSPTGDLLLVTCGNDGIVLDGKKLTKLRDIPTILPGCDNGPYLGGAVLPDGRTLLLEGCGGEAKVDLRRGKYLCGDSPGVMGAPYEMLGPSTSRIPPGRANAPACTDGNGSRVSLGRSKRHQRLYDPPALVADGTRIELEVDTEYQGSLAPDESAYAYVHGSRVAIRSLPDGKVRAEFGFPSRP